MFDYEEACPISRAATVLCERWTLQIIREMFLGATRFSEFQKYLPKMSPTLLNSRLKMLESSGIIIKRKIPEKKGYEYQLTPQGNALKPVLGEIGKWGMHWVFENMTDEELNVSNIVRDFGFALDLSQLPAGDCVIQFNISYRGATEIKFIMVREGKPEMCDDNISTDVHVYLTASLETFYEIWFGGIKLASAVDQDLLKVVGLPAYTRHISKWLRTSQFAVYNKKMTC